MTAILRGGPYDGFLCEIDAGQSELTMKPHLFTGPARPPDATYRYTGEMDAEENAVFEVADQ